MAKIATQLVILEALPLKPFEIKDPDVLYLDNHLLIVNKHPGVLVQSDKNEGPNIEDAARQYLKNKFNKPGNVFATAAHRLDRPVGGLVILARTSKALARMNQLFAERKIEKIYVALVEGKPEIHKHLRHWIKKNEGTNKVWTYTYQRNDAKQADLMYWQTGASNDMSLLCVRLFTGRHHQIRAQLSLAGLPIIGDLKYGNKTEIIRSPALFSFAASFEHPVTKERMLIKANFPDYGIWKQFSEPDNEMLNTALTSRLDQAVSEIT